ncbi:hypothetical protein Ciccas_013104 [Cichlidogyrus casuarinus]|uniref:Uncharacterized protein n=1 Tax=Cichlidogyrus casuarinus TaxID=1844966 RepID=A0ABD2PMI9_9PLAT
MDGRCPLINANFLSHLSRQHNISPPSEKTTSFNLEKMLIRIDALMPRILIPLQPHHPDRISNIPAHLKRSCHFIGPDALSIHVSSSKEKKKEVR